jgi:sulfatase modifying factor 1
MQKRTLFKALFAAAAAAALPAARAAGKPRVAVVYFSRQGGNTKSLAESVKHFTGADLYRLELQNPYPESYQETVDIVQEEQRKGVIRPIKPIAVDLTKYDAIVIATPTWWGEASGHVLSWIASVADFGGRKVVTANTHGGSGQARTRADIEKALKGKNAALGTHLAVYGRVSSEADSNVEKWLTENGLV